LSDRGNPILSTSTSPILPLGLRAKW
jgi:hypothetical protein